LAEFFDFGDGREDFEEFIGGAGNVGEADGAGVEEEGEGIAQGVEGSVRRAGEEVQAGVAGLFDFLGSVEVRMPALQAVEGGVLDWAVEAFRGGGFDAALGFGNGEGGEPIADPVQFLRRKRGAKGDGGAEAFFEVLVAGVRLGWELRRAGSGGFDGKLRCVSHGFFCRLEVLHIYSLVIDD